MYHTRAPADEANDYLAVLESIPDAVVTTSTQGQIRYLNLAAKRLLGCGLNEARDRPLQDFLKVMDGPTRRPVASPLSRYLGRSEQLSPAEFDILVRRDGSEVPIDCSLALIRAKSGDVTGVMLVLRDVSRTRDLLHHLAHRATHDGLTRLVNRDEFERRLMRLLGAMNGRDVHTLLYLDLDRFKNVNDTCGHAAGDAALCQVADIFRMTVRERDTVARLGGDEFGLLLEHCPATHAFKAACRLRKALTDRPFHWGGNHFDLDASIGLVPVTGRQDSAAALLRAADRACYAAKRGDCNAARVHRAPEPLAATP